MDQKLFRILKKVYDKKRYRRDENGYEVAIDTGDIFDVETGTTIYGTENLSQEELSYLTMSGYPVNEIVQDTHDETIAKLKEIIHHPNLSWDNLVAAYVAGFKSYPRGRQPILSYLFAKAVPSHSFYNAHGGTVCELCGLEKAFWLEKGRELFQNYWGYSWNETVSACYLDLAEFSELKPCKATEEDIHIFLSVIDMVRNAPHKETPGKLEQRIKKAKIIPHCEKYRLRGQLITLAELGVMPNPYIPPMYDTFTDTITRNKITHEVPGSSRSDVVLPLSGWRGENGICEERFHEIFGEYIT